VESGELKVERKAVAEQSNLSLGERSRAVERVRENDLDD
jgi:hypothetical protein